MRALRNFLLSLLGWSFLAISFLRCDQQTEKDTLFNEVSSAETGITFSNTVVQAGENNVLNYPYYFNGGGVAAGDINNDGLIDIYFTGNQVSNKLYLNKGNFEFEDITARSGVAAELGWKTGVTMTDVNQDGWLDIYVCRSAMEDSVLRENLLFINNKDLTFTEKAKAYGIADNSYSTHSAFFDYDRDGDLDLFVLNHSIPKYAGFNRLLKDSKNQPSEKFGSKLYRNEKGSYQDVTAEAGLINNVLSFGLGIGVSDVNMDGWPDLYVSNDFNEEDYLYINQRDGTFKNTIREATGHVSLFSMGSDIADMNNDSYPDIFTVDMLPESNERIKLSSGDDNYDKYQLLINAGFHHQSMRNMLQLNNGNGTFSEIGQLAGISNTDWSWAPLWADFDGDGWKDLFVTNGYEKDYTNMQFLKFTVDEQIKARQTGTSPNMKLILDNMPSIDAGNYLFKNNGDLTFTNASTAWGLDRKFKSNGAAYADLDKDGDADLVINVMNGVSAIYRNNSVENKANFLTIDLSHAGGLAVGSKIYCYGKNNVQHYEFYPSRGFQSSQYVPVNIGLGEAKAADSVRIVWPNGKTKLYSNISNTSVFKPSIQDAKKDYNYPGIAETMMVEKQDIQWNHTPVLINDFKRQFMLPRMYSSSGPKMASGDVNGDGLEDIYICAPHRQAGVLLLQRKDGTFGEKDVADFKTDKFYQDEDALFVDVDNDKDLDLLVVSGGYLFEPGDKYLQDRLYFNDGNGNFSRGEKSLPVETEAGSSIAAFDIDDDSDQDLFIGNRLIPGQYPLSPSSKILVNNGKGIFQDASDDLAPALENIGMVCDATSADLDGDKVPELILTGEWLPIKIFKKENGILRDATKQWFQQPTEGWWNCLLTADFDNDGDMDLMAGNFGQNNHFKVSAEQPATLVYKDFDNDKQVDAFLCYYVGGKSYPFASRDEALGQVTFLKRRFTDYTQYSNATLETIFKPEELNDVSTLKANTLSTVYFENTGKSFVLKSLPIEVQFSPVYAMAAADIDNDHDIDIVLGGNESDVRVRVGKSDASSGQILMNDGKGNFSLLPARQSGLQVDGDVRSILTIENKIIFGINKKPVRTFRLSLINQ